MRIAIATFAAVPPEFADDQLLAGELRARDCDVELVEWDDPSARWESFDAVVIRSTWDYASRREEFVGWAEGVGGRLHNSPRVVEWNSDKRYIGDLAEAGFATVPTTYVGPDDEPPPLEGEVVVKPTVSAGARDTGRFTPATHADAYALITALTRAGRTAMVQPYVASVDEVGETAIVCLNGEPGHVLRKRAVLRADEVAPVRDDGLGAAEAMYDPELVVAGEARPDELEFARKLLEHVADRMDYMPLYARVDLITGAGGEPVLMELEAIEPNFYLDQSPGAAARTAEAILARAGGA